MCIAIMNLSTSSVIAAYLYLHDRKAINMNTLTKMSKARNAGYAALIYDYIITLLLFTLLNYN